MKISDWIREFIDNEDLHPWHIVELRRIADRIDAEMVELPKDADGEPIHVGDTAYLKDGREVKVIRFIFEPETLTIVCSLDGNPDVVRLPFELWHKRPDSWETIADELEEWREDNRVNGSGDVFFRAGDLADRIRRLAEKEGQR